MKIHPQGWGISELYWILQTKPNLSKTRCKEIIVLSKTIWMEGHKTYKTYLLLFKVTVIALELICEQQLYNKSYESLENN